MNTRNVTNTAFTSYPATGVELPNGRQLANIYDALYRRTLVQDVTNSVNVAAWQFLGPGRVAEVTLGNGLICSWLDNARTNSAVQPSVTNPAWGSQSSDRLGYDGAGRPITKRYLAGGINGSTGAYNNSSAVVGFTTEYDLSSNKFYERHLHCPERSHLYEPFSNGAPTGGYDSVNRLRQYQRGTLTSNDGFAGNGGGSVATPITLPNTDTQRTYDLDSLGNWRRTVFTPEGGSQETEIRQHNGLNEITRIQNGSSQTNLTYDGVPGASNGNLANDGTRTYQWDVLNRLLQVNRVSDGAIIGQYVYDALNRRIRKTVSNGGLSGTIPNGTTDCVYSGWRCVEERNPFGGGGSTDTPTAQYIWGIYLDECLQQRLLVATNNFAANSDLYPLQDLLYRTTGLADSAGTVREAYDTDAYGNTLILRNSGTPPAAIAWTDSDTQVNFPTCPFIFTGQRFDPETTLYYYKERYYYPSLAIFLSRDSFEVSSNVSAYNYADSAAVTFVDTFGLITVYSAPGINDSTNVIANDVQSYIKWRNDTNVTYGGHRRSKITTSTLGANPGKTLDDEADALARANAPKGKYCRGNGKTRIGVVLIAPKTDVGAVNRLVRNTKCCCDIQFIVFRDVHDSVPNPHGGGREEWVRRRGNAPDVKNRDSVPGAQEYHIVLSGDRARHNWEVGVVNYQLPQGGGGSKTVKSPSGSPFSAGKQGPPVGYSEDVSGAPQRTDFSGQVGQVLSTDKDFGYVCHSQGCNIVMHELVRACLQ